MTEGNPTTDLLSIPGPWRLDDPSNAHVLGDNDGYHVIEGDSETEHLRFSGFIPLDVARAITAVPDLLALARQYASECSNCGGSGVVNVKFGGDGYGDRCAAEADGERPCDECEDIRAVIAKAEGKL